MPPPHVWLIFAFLVETGFCHVGQAGLELLNPGDLPASASHSVGVTGVSQTPVEFAFFIKRHLVNFEGLSFQILPKLHESFFGLSSLAPFPPHFYVFAKSSLCT